MLPALQQGAIDGALSTITVFTTLHFGDAAKYSIEIGQPYVNTIAELSKKWFESLPADLQKILRDDGAAVSKEIVPWVNEFFAAQKKVWTDKGGEFINLPADEQAAMIAKFASVGNDLSKDKPALNKAVELVVESAARNK